MHLRDDIVKTTHRLFAKADKGIDQKLADARFGEYRDTSLGRWSQGRLVKLRQLLFTEADPMRTNVIADVSIVRPTADHPSTGKPLPFLHRNTMINVASKSNLVLDFKYLPARTVGLPPAGSYKHQWEEGDQVLVDFDGTGTLYRASITDVKHHGNNAYTTYTVVYDDGGVDTGVSPSSIAPLTPINEGEIVMLHTDPGDPMAWARAVAVRPSGVIEAQVEGTDQIIEIHPDEFARRHPSKV